MIYTILGQTASGKTSLALSLARKYSLGIISADAFQCYKMMQIGTDKPKSEDIKGLEFYFNDEYEITQEISVYLFQKECRAILDKFIAEDRDVIVVGGTFLYIKALLFDYTFKEEERDRNTDYDSYPLQALQDMLKEIDPTSFSRIDIKNKRRVIRALIRAQNGLKDPDIRDVRGEKPLYETKFYRIDIDKELGNKKIDERVDQMIDDGFVDEVKRLLSKYPKDLRPLHCIGYDEIITALDSGKEIDKDVIDLIKIHTHQYAKKQRTFLKNQFSDIISGSKEEIYDLIEEDIKKRRNL